MEILGGPRRGCNEIEVLVPVVFGGITLEEAALGDGEAAFTTFMLPEILKGQKYRERMVLWGTKFTCQIYSIELNPPGIELNPSGDTKRRPNHGFAHVCSPEHVVPHCYHVLATVTRYFS